MLICSSRTPPLQYYEDATQKSRS